MQQAFDSLNHRTQVRCLAGLARTALRAYPVHGARLRLLAHFWNTTFRVTVPDGNQYMLRVHHRGQTSAEAVRSELLWLARFHRHAAQWSRPREFTRHRVDNLDPMQREQDDRFDPAVAARVTQTVTDVCAPEAGRVIATAIHRIWATLQALGEEADAFGLIHGDLHHRNFLFGKGGIGAIDFDDCGYGHWLYDLAVPLTMLRDHPAYAGLRQGLLTGYRRRRPLPVDQEAHLETFMALRTVQDVLGMIKEKDHPAFRDWWEAAAARGIDHLRAFTAR